MQLTASGVVELFTETYGPDIAGIPKGGREFYDSILVHSGVDPAVALFVDDAPNSIRRVVEAGARGVLISSSEEESMTVVRLSSLSQLPQFLKATSETAVNR